MHINGILRDKPSCIARNSSLIEKFRDFGHLSDASNNDQQFYGDFSICLILSLREYDTFSQTKTGLTKFLLMKFDENPYIGKIIGYIEIQR